MSLNGFARYRHDTILGQRMQAINNATSRLSKSATETLLFIQTLRLGSDIADPFMLEIHNIINNASTAASRIKAEIKIISRCNYYWIQMQPIVCNDDALRYLDFMNISYRATVKDMIELMEYIETNIAAMNDQREYLSKLRPQHLYIIHVFAFSVILVVLLLVLL